MKKLQISIRHYFDLEDIKCLLDSASRGSSYWCENTLAYESEVEKVFSEEGLEIKDIEDEELRSEIGKRYILNTDKIKKGLRVLAKKYPTHFADFVSGNYDMYTGDIFLQCCLFGKEVYS